jgi:ABC-type multidrug transport system permease subunit
MKKLLGAGLFIAGFVFLVWKQLTFGNMTFMTSLLLNIVAFIPITIGLKLFKEKPIIKQSEAPSNPEILDEHLISNEVKEN